MDNPDQSGKSKTGVDPTDKEEPKGLISADRLKALANGVFAVAMTLLVLELVVPQIRDPSNQELTHALLSMWPKFLAYVLSFLIAGIFWLVHHSIFDAIKYYDSTLSWIKVLFLLLVALVPFTTSLLGEYFLQKTATIIYGVHLLFLFFGGFSLWSYSTSKHLLVVKDLDPGLVKGAKRMGYLYFVILSAAIIIGFFHPLISVIIYGLFVLIILVFTGVGKAHQVFTFTNPNIFNHGREE
jgi:uncharacterized membrane protein